MITTNKLKDDVSKVVVDRQAQANAQRLDRLQDYVKAFGLQPAATSQLDIRPLDPAFQGDCLTMEAMYKLVAEGVALIRPVLALIFLPRHQAPWGVPAAPLCHRLPRYPPRFAQLTPCGGKRLPTET